MTLTGLSFPKFNDAILSIHAIEDIFQWLVVERNMEAWVPSSFQGHTSFDVSNWYFTPRQHALQDHHLLFSPSIDLDNILSEAMGDEFVHTEDNEVEYYEAHKKASGTKWVTDSQHTQRYLKTVMQAPWDQPQCYMCWGYCGSINIICRHTIERKQEQDGSLRAITVLDKGPHDVRTMFDQWLPKLIYLKGCDQGKGWSTSQAISYLEKKIRISLWRGGRWRGHARSS